MEHPRGVAEDRQWVLLCAEVIAGKVVSFVNSAIRTIASRHHSTLAGIVPADPTGAFPAGAGDVTSADHSLTGLN
jgi:hypothetical protein